MPLREVSIHNINDEKAEILAAIFLSIGYEGSYQENDSFFAYIQDENFSKDELIQALHRVDKKMQFQTKVLEDKNWNKAWEEEYDAVRIKNCLIRADFHPKREDVEYNILINPQMSFGTAHHPTTALMVEAILDMDIKDKAVMDMGAGTAVLAILAALKGAASVDAVDNDEWAYKNALENVQKNNCRVNVFQDDAAFLVKNNKKSSYDIFIANINRNILLNDIYAYAKAMKSKAVLLLSGFYEKDVPLLVEEAEKHELEFIERKHKNLWQMLVLKKI